MLGDWKSSSTSLIDEIERSRCSAIGSYEANPKLIEEHVGLEQEAGTGGYGRRQIFELIQNGTDQLEQAGGRIRVVLTPDALYCANSGSPFSTDGLVSVLHAYVSEKSDDSIGKFGLGFKSVLGVTNEPLVLSRSGSFRFGPAIAERHLRPLSPDTDQPLPLLRVAEAVDPAEAFRSDETLREFQDWAATVVKLPFEASFADWLLGDLTGFPIEFLVFARNVTSLEIESRIPASELARSIQVERDGHLVSAVEGERRQEWITFSDDIVLSEAAKVKAGKLAERDEVTVTWAVEETGGRSWGSFWSYFPTHDETTLSGALNAPWQLSPDRLHLIEDSAYNKTILEGASRLIASSVEDLHAAQGDPGRHLDLVPARGKEARCWADDVLTQATNSKLRVYPSVPLANGELALPIEAKLHPEGLSSEALAAWLKTTDAEAWVHHAIDRGDRRARVRSYMDDPDGQTASLGDWFLSVVADGDEAASSAAIRLADRLLGETPAEALRSLPFVLTEDGKVVAPAEPGLCLPGAFDPPGSGVLLVNATLASSPEIASALKRLGIETISSDVELRRLVHELPPTDDEGWLYFWKILREVGAARAAEIVLSAEEFEPRVRTVSGDWRRPLATLLPGTCVPANGERDATAAVDIQGFHRADLQILQRFSCVQSPTWNGGRSSEPWFEEYFEEARRRFLVANKAGSPSKDLIEFETSRPFAGPMTAMRALSDEGKAEFVRLAFAESGSMPPWTMHHRSVSKYASIRIQDPAVWLVTEEGMLPTPIGPLSVSSCVAPELTIGELVPAAQITAALAEALGLPNDWSDVPAPIVEQSLSRALDASPADAAALYGNLVELIDPPASLNCIQSAESAITAPDAIFVSCDEEHRELLLSGSSPILFVESVDLKRLFIEFWGLKDAAGLISRRLVPSDATPPVTLTDLFPPLRKKLEPADRDITLVRCSELRAVEETAGGTRSYELDIEREGNNLYCLGSFDDGRLISLISAHLGLGLSRENIDRIIQKVDDQKIRDLRKEVRSAPTNAEKLSLLVSERDLRSQIPEPALDAYTALRGRPSHRKLADLALNVHGVETLGIYRDDIAKTGIEVPRTWAGSRPAGEFVRSLGFEESYAGFSAGGRRSELILEGAPKLHELHDYQSQIVDEMKKLLDLRSDNKAMLSLPTGSGKTRIAIEGVIAALEEELIEDKLILWVAQTEELCEQAVQAWKELWRGRGMAQMLTLNRLWDSNAADPASDGVQVVVATIAKLGVIMETDDYAWLASPGVVIVDEAHASTSPSYGQLRRWLNLDRGKFGAPVVGLSATPFKGRSEELNLRLAKLYGQRRLDAISFPDGDHHAKLQELGVISRVKHEVLEGGDLTLTADEEKKMIAPAWLPTSADRRLGEDIERTGRIIESIRSLPADWPVLVFAPSVENAQALAGLLSEDGIPSAPIYGELPKRARRWYIDEFKAGRIRVVTNYHVLAEGFDAPAIRAVYVARPVYAPNLYQQMIGRGLRGELNGGKPECLIVDVEDNIRNFDRQLAFREFEYLWDPTFSEVSG